MSDIKSTDTTNLNQSGKPRVRFAPSPTGYLHVGSLRTALYNYLFAKKHGGTYVLRIEDTDQSRLVEDAMERLVRSLAHMGVNADEGVLLDGELVVEKGEYGPYQQSHRLSIYRQYVDELVAQGKAYPCFCTAERLDTMRKEMTANKQAPKYDKHCANLAEEDVKALLDAEAPHVIRFNVTPGEDIVFTDLVRGEVKINTKEVDDQVLLKSDGFPTYHLAVVVDDHLMGITHILRSEEWLPSTPKHILLYKAFGWKMPEIGHVSVILGPDGKKKLSKRDGGASVDEFLEKGYLEEVLINFLVLLGWNPGGGSTQEIFSLSELESIFDLKGLHKAGAVFDHKKLDWMNSAYIKAMPLDELYNRIEKGGWFAKDLVQFAPTDMQTKEYLLKVLAVEQERLVRLDMFGEENPFFFQLELSYDKGILAWKQNTEEMTREALEKAFAIIEKFTDAEWVDKAYIESVLLEAAGDKKGDFLWPLRVALTGAERSPSPFEVLYVLGKDHSLERIVRALAMLR
ncbi:MAG: glutamate--tRNA ligase [Candidatus Moranbacteria bacterium]|nr:glutamate--tRNA ligase [Candidatus Moranbacteria bacterium]